MQPLSSFEDLEAILRHNSSYSAKRFLLLLLISPKNRTKATEEIIDQIEHFHAYSGDIYDIFLPGFFNMEGSVILDDEHYYNFFKNGQNTHYEKYTLLNCRHEEKTIVFDDVAFAHFCHVLAVHSDQKWGYQGDATLVVVDSKRWLSFRDASFYNLEDIVRNQNTVTQFIDAVINILANYDSSREAKRDIDDRYYDLISIQNNKYDDNYLAFCRSKLEMRFNPELDFTFISYSSKQKRYADKIREHLNKHGIKCWMAPYNIPIGTSYAYIIGDVLTKANNFLLLLSPSCLDSIWVIKELLFALSKAKDNKEYNVYAVWLNEEFSLVGTEFEYPLVNIQIKKVDTNDEDSMNQLVKILKPEK